MHSLRQWYYKIENNNACTRRKQTITSCRLGCYFTTNVSGTWRYFRKIWRWTSRFDLVGQVLPTEYPFVAVMAYCLGMMLFTVVMGNAFAAFAVITGGIGLPLIVQMHGGNPAIMAALGMFAGYCGTLLTPMAANFNIVPAMLLELKDKNAVIKAQVPIALSIFIINMFIMYGLVYRF